MPVDAEPLAEAAALAEFNAVKPRTLYEVDGGLAVAVKPLEYLALAAFDDAKPRELYVSHFTTCPNAGNFSGRAKSRPAKARPEPRRMPWD